MNALMLIIMLYGCELLVVIVLLVYVILKRKNEKKIEEIKHKDYIEY